MCAIGGRGASSSVVAVAVTAALVAFAGLLALWAVAGIWVLDHLSFD